LLLPYLERDEIDELHNEAASKIRRLCFLAEKHTHVTDKLAATLEDIFHLASEATLSAFDREHHEKRLKEHLWLLSKSNKSPAKIKEDFEQDPRWCLSARQAGTLIKRQKSMLKAGESMKAELERQLERNKKITSEVTAELENLKDFNAHAEQNIKNLRQDLEDVENSNDIEWEGNTGSEWEESEGETVYSVRQRFV
jgi:anthranilate/para-aminobenzoate synthase component I